MVNHPNRSKKTQGVGNILIALEEAIYAKGVACPAVDDLHTKLTDVLATARLIGADIDAALRRSGLPPVTI